MQYTLKKDTLMQNIKKLFQQQLFSALKSEQVIPYFIQHDP
jgi:hypothetical protein